MTEVELRSFSSIQGWSGVSSVASVLHRTDGKPSCQTDTTNEPKQGKEGSQIVKARRTRQKAEEKTTKKTVERL